MEPDCRGARGGGRTPTDPLGLLGSWQGLRESVDLCPPSPLGEGGIESLSPRIPA